VAEDEGVIAVEETLPALGPPVREAPLAEPAPAALESDDPRNDTRRMPVKGNRIDRADSGDTTVKLVVARAESSDTGETIKTIFELDPDTVDRVFADLENSEIHVQMPSGLHDHVPFVERRRNPADVLRQAIEREPARQDLRLKLLELYYTTAAVNQQAFLDVVRKLAKESNHTSLQDWNKIVAMGREIAADDALFAEDSQPIDSLSDCA
jgi:hypothetical protein